MVCNRKSYQHGWWLGLPETSTVLMLLWANFSHSHTLTLMKDPPLPSSRVCVVSSICWKLVLSEGRLIHMQLTFQRHTAPVQFQDICSHNFYLFSTFHRFHFWIYHDHMIWKNAICKHIHRGIRTYLPSFPIWIDAEFPRTSEGLELVGGRLMHGQLADGGLTVIWRWMMDDVCIDYIMWWLWDDYIYMYIDDYGMIIWRFPKIGVPPVLIYLNEIVHNYPFGATPILGNPL